MVKTVQIERFRVALFIEGDFPGVEELMLRLHLLLLLIL